MRRRFPYFRTLPSSTLRTFSFFPISRISRVLLRNWNAEVRATTCNPRTLPSESISSAANPSLNDHRWHRRDFGTATRRWRGTHPRRRVSPNGAARNNPDGRKEYERAHESDLLPADLLPPDRLPNEGRRSRLMGILLSHSSAVWRAPGAGSPTDVLAASEIAGMSPSLRKVGT